MARVAHILERVAEAGACVAAKDVSMAGLLGSLAMLLEYGRLGACVDLDALPRPAGVPLPQWVVAFPAFSFLLCSPPERVADCRHPFLERGLSCEPVAVLDGSGELRVRLGDAEALVLDQLLGGGPHQWPASSLVLRIRTLRNSEVGAPWLTAAICPGCALPQLNAPCSSQVSGPPTASREFQKSVVVAW